MWPARIILVLALSLLVEKAKGQEWDWTFSASSNGTETISGLDFTDQGGFGVAAGSFSQPLSLNANGPVPYSPGQIEPFVFSFDPQGNILNVASFPASEESFAEDVAIDDNENIFIGGSFEDSLDVSGSLVAPIWMENSNIGVSAWVTCLDSNFQHQWNFKPAGNNSSEVREIEVRDTLVIVAGVFQGTLTAGSQTINSSPAQENVFVLALARQSGNPVWLRGIFSPGPLTVSGMTTDANRIYFSGTLDNSTANYLPLGPAITAPAQMQDIFLTALDLSGTPLWLESYGGPGDEFPSDLVARNGVVYAVGTLADSVDFGNNWQLGTTGSEDGWMASFSGANGQCQWAYAYGGTANGSSRDGFLEIDLGPDDLLYVSAQAEDSLHFAPGSSAANPGNVLSVVASFDLQGSYLGWFTFAYNSQSMGARGLEVESDGVYTGGNYSSNLVNFQNAAGLQLPASGQQNIWMGKLSCPTTTVGQVTTSATSICGQDTVVFSIPNSDPAFSYALIDSATGNPLGNPVPGNAGLLQLEAGPFSNSMTILVEYFSSPSCGEIYPVSFPIALISAPQPDLGPDTTICENLPYTLSPGNFSGYQWSVGMTSLGSNPTITVNSASSYLVKVQDQFGCTASDTVVIEVWFPPNATLDSLGELCEGDTLALAPSSCMDCATFLWSNGDTSASTFVTSGGQYVLETFSFPEAMSGVVCSEFDTIWVDETVFSVALATDTGFCVGDSVELVSQVVAQSYVWSNGDTGNATTVSSGGIYTVDMVAGNCSGSDTILVTQVAPPTADLGADTSFCGSQTLMLDPGTATSYLWQDGSTNPTFSATQSGTYSVTLSNAAGCSDSTSITIDMFPIPTVSINGVDSLYCESDGADFLVISPGGGQFIGGPLTGNVLDPAQIGAGTYAIAYAYADSNGCRDTAQVDFDIDAAPSDPDAGADMVVSASAEVSLSGNAPAVGTGLWTVSPAGPTIISPTAPSSSLDNLLPGEYTFTWTTSNGSCPTKSDEVLLIVNALAIPTGFSPNGDEVNDRFVIRGIEDYGTRRFTVFNRWGNQVYASNSYENEWDGDNLTDDTYYYTLDLGEEGNYSGYVILKR